SRPSARAPLTEPARALQPKAPHAFGGSLGVAGSRSLKNKNGAAALHHGRPRPFRTTSEPRLLAAAQHKDTAFAVNENILHGAVGGLEAGRIGLRLAIFPVAGSAGNRLFPVLDGRLIVVDHELIAARFEDRAPELHRLI